MDIRAPYPGLRAFRQDESDLFFGRDEEADVILERLATNRFVGVLGASGSGKSSLVRTTVFEALEGGFSGIGSQWRFVDCRPGGAPIAHLAQELAKTSAIEGDAADPEKVEAWLRRGPLSIVEWCEAGGLGSDCQLLILIDQFEELFNYASNAARGESQAFASMLMESAKSGRAPIYVMITMRSEYFGATAAYPDFAETLTKGLFLTPRMLREACREAIVGPAAVVGFEVREDLVNRLLNDMERLASFARAGGGDLAQAGRQADQLPLMQYALNSMWRAATARGETPIVLTLDDYSAIGGLAGALDSHGGEVIAALGLPEAAIGRVFRSLVKGPNAALAVRDPHTVAEIAAISGIPLETVLQVVTAFSAADCQFLRADLPLTALTYVDITHESLIRQWGKLSGWLTEEADAAEAWTQLAKNAENWEAAGRPEGALLSGLLLARPLEWWKSAPPTEAWAARYTPPSTRGHEPVTLATARAFLDAGEARRLSEARTDARRRRQLQWLGAASISALVVLMGGFGVGGFLIARQQTILAESRQELSERSNRYARQQSAYASTQRALAQQNAAYATVLLQQKTQLQVENARERQLQAQAQEEARKSGQSLRAVLDLVGTSATQLAASVDKPETAAADTRDEAEQLASFLEKRQMGTVAGRAPQAAQQKVGARGDNVAGAAPGADITRTLINLKLIAAESAADAVGVKYASSATAGDVDENVNRVNGLLSDGRACARSDAEFAAECGALDVMRGRRDALRNNYPAAGQDYARAFEALKDRTDPDSLAWAFKAAKRLIDLHLLLDDPLVRAAARDAATWCVDSAVPLPLLSPDPRASSDRKKLALLHLQCQLAAADMKRDDGGDTSGLLTAVSQNLLLSYRDEQNLSWARAVIALALLTSTTPSALSSADLAAQTHFQRSLDAEEAQALKADTLRGDPAVNSRLAFLNLFPDGWNDKAFVLRTLQLYLLSSSPKSDHDIQNLESFAGDLAQNDKPPETINANLRLAISDLNTLQAQVKLVDALKIPRLQTAEYKKILTDYYDDVNLKLAPLEAAWLAKTARLMNVAWKLLDALAIPNDAIMQLQENGAVVPGATTNGVSKVNTLYLPAGEIDKIKSTIAIRNSYDIYCNGWISPGPFKDILDKCTVDIAVIDNELRLLNSFGSVVKSRDDYDLRPGRPVAFDGRDLVSYWSTGNDKSKVLFGRTDLNESYPIDSKSGVTFFATLDNLKLFRDNPKKYAPLFYGYAADWLIYGELKSPSLDKYCVIGGYLVFFSEDAQTQWCAANPDGPRARNLLAMANRQWAALGPPTAAIWPTPPPGPVTTPVKRKSDKPPVNLSSSWVEYRFEKPEAVFFPTTGILTYQGGTPSEFETYYVHLANGNITNLALQGATIDMSKLRATLKDPADPLMVHIGDPMPLSDKQQLKILRWGEFAQRAINADNQYKK